MIYPQPVILHGVSSRTLAAGELHARGIKWDRVLADRMMVQRWDYQNGTHVAQQPGIHEYFMLGDGDVAYWTPLIQALHINNYTRRWAEISLQKTITLEYYREETYDRARQVG